MLAPSKFSEYLWRHSYNAYQKKFIVFWVYVYLHILHVYILWILTCNISLFLKNQTTQLIQSYYLADFEQPYFLPSVPLLSHSSLWSEILILLTVDHHTKYLGTVCYLKFQWTYFWVYHSKKGQWYLIQVPFWVFPNTVEISQGCSCLSCMHRNMLLEIFFESLVGTT